MLKPPSIRSWPSPAAICAGRGIKGSGAASWAWTGEEYIKANAAKKRDAAERRRARVFTIYLLAPPNRVCGAVELAKLEVCSALASLPSWRSSPARSMQGARDLEKCTTGSAASPWSDESG